MTVCGGSRTGGAWFAALALSLLALRCGNGGDGGPRSGLGGSGPGQALAIANQRQSAIYVTCSSGIFAATGPCTLTWGSGCQSNGQSDKGIYAIVAPGTTCQVSVASSTGPSRLCASETSADVPDCWQAQWNHVTLLETNFTTSEVFYDLSIIPLNFGTPGCFNDQWEQDFCNASGQASYNLPVSFGCSLDPAVYFTCQGPASQKWGAMNLYPGTCGNPPKALDDPSLCVCGQACSPCNVTTFFYPMATLPEGTKTPVRSCASTGTLEATFLAGS
jgi:hypothetical protein